MQKNNKVIAKNAIVLYFRMILTMAVALYTSRVILQSLGIEDYGIYNVVGGVVSMVGILKGVMTGASTRFLNIALGKDNHDLANKYFNVSLSIYIFLSAIVVILGETIGLWFLNTQLTIPAERIVAANCVYQFSLLTLVNSLTAIPYNSTIVAHERMGVYAYLGIAESLIKLLIAYILIYIDFDRLILYGLLLLFSEITVRMISRLYCMRHFAECKWHFYSDKLVYKEILSYSGWNMLGVLSTMIKGQGLNILLNMFFNPVVNAARGVSYQVNHAIVQLGTNFYTAVRPQVIKNYAKGNLTEMINLIFWSSKITFFLLALIAMPIFIEASPIIDIWLGKTPEHTVDFVRFMIVISLFDAISNPISTAIQATGKVALFQIVVTILTLLNIPTSFLLLSLSFPPETVYEVSLVIQISLFFIRIIILNKYIDFPIYKYVTEVFCRCLLSLLISFLCSYQLVTYFGSSFYHIILFCFISIIISFACFAMIAINGKERAILFSYLNKFICKCKK